MNNWTNQLVVLSQNGHLGFKIPNLKLGIVAEV